MEGDKDTCGTTVGSEFQAAARNKEKL